MATLNLKPMSLRAWLDEVGARQAAALLHVDIKSISHWRRGVCLPRDEQKRLIKKYSRGAVSYDAMIDQPKKRSAK